MKNLYLIGIISLLTALSIQQATAQPTITYANFGQQVGESFTVHGIDMAAVTEGASGAAVTWDFSTLVDIGTQTGTWIAPGSTPYASSFPTSNIALDGGGGNYVYYSSTASGFGNCGAYMNTVTQYYDDMEEIIRYPFTFNDTYVDNLACTFVSGGTWYRTGTITVTADGYGTLILPWGTVNNVLRLHLVEDYEDSTAGWTVEYDVDMYKWLVPGTKYFLHEQTTMVIDQTTTQKSGTFLDQLSIGIDNYIPLEGGLKVYPNPLRTTSHISFQMGNTARVNIRLFDLLGQQLKTIVEEELPAGNHRIGFDAHGLPNGIYILQKEVGGMIESERIIVER